MTTDNKAKPKKRIHHYLPQCYLKKFAKNDSKKSSLFCINLENGSMFETTPKKIGCKRDFNRVDHPKFDPDSLEDELAKIEGEIHKSLQEMEKVDTFSKLNPEHKNRMLYFVALLALRTPKIREHWSNQMDHAYKVMLDMAASTPVGSTCNGQVITQEFKNFVKEGDFRVVTSRSDHIHREFVGVDTILPLLHKRKWRIFKTTDAMPFITSDAPAILTWDNDKIGKMSPGFALTNTIVLMPLSKNMSIVGRFEWDDDLGYVDATKELVASINANILHHSQQFIYCPTKRFWFIKQDGILTSDIDEFIKR